MSYSSETKKGESVTHPGHPDIAYTSFGFVWHDVEVQRCYERDGYVTVSLIHRKSGKRVQVQFSPAGRKVRVEEGT